MDVLVMRLSFMQGCNEKFVERLCETEGQALDTLTAIELANAAEPEEGTLLFINQYLVCNPSYYKKVTFLKISG